jgi:ABC-type branched-subunit amino acid transport system ATPase component
MNAVLEAKGITVGYGDLRAVRDLNVGVGPGEVVALLGPNGAGKTTSLLALAGVLKPMSGTVHWHGQAVRTPLHRRAQAGLACVFEDRSIVSSLSVRDNLRLGGADEQVALRWFPALSGLARRRAGLLSGGEQQMLSIGRAISRNPAAILIDELSQGLAPQTADQVGEAVRNCARQGIAVIVVEQKLNRALAISDRFYLLTHGSIAVAGRSEQHRHNPAELQRHFFDAG